jgi:uncharacterized membrane protein
MDLIQLLVVLVVVGVVLWLINTYVPMQAPFKTIINIIVVLFVCIWLLNAFGIMSPRVGPRP